MSKKDDALKLALENICAAKLCEFNSMSSRHEMIRLMDAAITAIREALAHAQEVREQPAEQHQCSRSHPHENMDAMCELRTKIARLTNENARLKARHQDDEINAYRMTLLCIRDGLQQGMSKSIQKLQAREINDVLGLPSFASYRTSPPASKPWVGLTDEQLESIWAEFGLAMQPTRKAIARAIEAKLREKNA